MAEGLSFHRPHPMRRASDTIHVGLVNNMPDTALRTTELQFARLLKDSAGDFDVRLRLFSLPEIPRSELALSRMEGIYADAGTIPHAKIDALIVTGAEPRAADLRDEPYWTSFEKLTDWAQTSTISTMFSCLATHAAVLAMDDVGRRPLPQKMSGLYRCGPVESNSLLSNDNGPFAIPHSRYNEVVEEDLIDKGYRIVTRVLSGGVDMFMCDAPSRLVFLQGHPEYDPESLGREYVRDVGRWLRGERPDMPPVPENYFDRYTVDALSRLAGDARDPEALPLYADLVARSTPQQAWRGNAVRLFSNWLRYVATEKTRRRALQPDPVSMRKSAWA